MTKILEPIHSAATRGAVADAKQTHTSMLEKPSWRFCPECNGENGHVYGCSWFSRSRY